MAPTIKLTKVRGKVALPHPITCVCHYKILYILLEHWYGLGYVLRDPMNYDMIAKTSMIYIYISYFHCNNKAVRCGYADHYQASRYMLIWVNTGSLWWRISNFKFQWKKELKCVWNVVVFFCFFFYQSQSERRLREALWPICHHEIEA